MILGGVGEKTSCRAPVFLLFLVEKGKGGGDRGPWGWGGVTLQTPTSSPQNLWNRQTLGVTKAFEATKPWGSPKLLEPQNLGGPPKPLEPPNLEVHQTLGASQNLWNRQTLRATKHFTPQNPWNLQT